MTPAEFEQWCRALRLAPATRELMDTFIAEQFETPRHAPAASVYRAYEQECKARMLTPLSARAFYDRIKQRSGPEQTEKWSGARAAYQETPWVWELAYLTPRHGMRPFEVVHIDHTPLDIELRCSSTGRLLGTPWATFMTDAYSRRLLAVYLTFDPPSYRSVIMVLRICVQRFGRLPQNLVVDGGREFNNMYFDTLLARYHCTRKTRPAKPRYGSVIERLFETTNQSPREAFLWGMQHGGEREHRRIPYDEAFVRDTCPSTAKGSAKVQRGSGIKVNHFYYWNNDFRNPEVVKTSVPIHRVPSGWYKPSHDGSNKEEPGSFLNTRGNWMSSHMQRYLVNARMKWAKLVHVFGGLPSQRKSSPPECLYRNHPLNNFTFISQGSVK